MKSSAIVALAALLALVRSTDACAALDVYTACVQLETTNLNSCGASDWVCRCPWERALLTCYSDCPDDVSIQQQSVVQQGQVTTICTAANQTLAASSAAAAAAASATVTTVLPSSSSSSFSNTSSVTNTLLTSIPSSSVTTSASNSTTSQKSAASANQIASGVFTAGIAAVVALLAL